MITLDDLIQTFDNLSHGQGDSFAVLHTFPKGSASIRISRNQWELAKANSSEKDLLLTAINTALEAAKERAFFS
jgi:hypothetical protein